MLSKATSMQNVLHKLHAHLSLACSLKSAFGVKGQEVLRRQESCLSCHNPKNYDTLALANGEAVPYRRTMNLCAQCHGPQYRDYNHGSHGGMTGYWDRTRGERRHAS